MAKFKMNREALKKLRKSPKVRADLYRRAKNIAEAAESIGAPSDKPKGYKVTQLWLEDPRGAVSVLATGHAAASNRKHNSLVRSLGAGRD